jgi:hypothetical protein
MDRAERLQQDLELYRWRGPQVDHTLGPLAHIPTGSTTNGFLKKIEEERDPTSYQDLTGQNISAKRNRRHGVFQILGSV